MILLCYSDDNADREKDKVAKEDKSFVEVG